MYGLILAYVSCVRSRDLAPYGLDLNVVIEEETRGREVRFCRTDLSVRTRMKGGREVKEKSVTSATRKGGGELRKLCQTSESLRIAPRGHFSQGAKSCH